MNDIKDMSLKELRELREEVDRLIFLNGSMRFTKAAMGETNGKR